MSDRLRNKSRMDSLEGGKDHELTRIVVVEDWGAEDCALMKATDGTTWKSADGPRMRKKNSEGRSSCRIGFLALMRRFLIDLR